MSQPTQPTLPDPQAAYNHLFNTVHAPAFFAKLAQAGIAPANEKEAADYLEMAGKLRTIQQDPRVKAAQDNSGSRVTQAKQALDQLMSQHGLGGQARQISLQKVAASLADDPNIYNAVLSLKAAEASAVQAQLAANPA